MDNQQEQQNQKLNQETEHTSEFLEEEVVEESVFDEPIEEQEKVGNMAESDQNNPEGEKQPKRAKRPRKTIEQEIAELDARREMLMEKKRRQEAHEKIVFGIITIKALKNALISTNRKFAAEKIIAGIMETSNEKEKKIVEKILYEIKNIN